MDIFKDAIYVLEKLKNYLIDSVIFYFIKSDVIFSPVVNLLCFDMSMGVYWL